jgi:membrane-associated phospholipid phosphatase
MPGKANKSTKTSVDSVSQAPTNGAGVIMPAQTPMKLPEMQPVAEAQRAAAQSSVSGRKAVSRATVFMALYLWLLSGVVILSWIAQRIQLFPGDMAITARLQKNREPVLRKFFFGISEIGFPNIAAPITAITAVIFWILRFRLESIFILLTSSSTLLNQIVKRVIKRPRPNNELVTVVRVINEPSFPSGHVMYYTNFYGLLIYLLTTNWRSGRIRNILIGICASMIAFIGPSRVYLGAHWPSDVLAGYMYGGLWFAGLMAFYLRVKSWVHPLRGKTPEAAKPLKQPSDADDDDDDDEG